MKKICILQNSMNYGGTDTFVINLCNGLIQDGYDVTVILSVDKDEILPREIELSATGAKILKTCHLRGLSSKLRHLKLLYLELKKGKYDVFQSNIDLFNGPQMLISWLAKVPIRVCHSHNSQQSKELDYGKTISIKIYQKVMRWLCWNFSNRRCGCSKQALDFLFQDRWKKDEKAKIIHNGIDLSRYQKSIDKGEQKKILGLGDNRYITTIGRISFQKNPEFLLDVFIELSKVRNDVDLIWCGNGENEEIIKEKIIMNNLSNRVKMLGSRNDIPEILKASDLFFLPSRFEGLGIVLIEAQAAQLPCVISDVIPQEVNCGLCLPIALDKDKKYWVKKISDVINNKITFELDHYKLEKYSINTMIKEMEEVFK